MTECALCILTCYSTMLGEAYVEIPSKVTICESQIIVCGSLGIWSHLLYTTHVKQISFPL